MKCPDIGILQSYIDCELEIDEKKKLEMHISSCPDCNTSLKALKENDDFSFEKLSEYRQFFENGLTAAQKTPHPAKKAATEAKQSKGVYYYMLKYKKIISAACAVLAVTVCVTVQPVRAAISNALMIFRVENVKGFNISINDIQQIKNKLANNEAEIDMNKLGKVKTTGGEHKKLSVPELSALKDLNVSLPKLLSGITPEVSTIEPVTVEFTLNTDSVNKALKSLGATKPIPASVDGKAFRVDFSRQVTLSYVTEGKNNLYITASKSPEIKVPQDVDVDALYNSLVDLPVLPENMQRQLKSIKDWKSTLYIPVVEKETREVDINGSKGFLSSDTGTQVNMVVDGKSTAHPASNSGTRQTYTSLIWYSNGIVTVMNGNLSSEEILNIAKSMK